MSDYPYQFTSKIEMRGEGKMAAAVVYLPKKLQQKLPLKEQPRLRVEAEINGFRHNGAFQPAKGRWYLMLSRKVLKLCHLSVGDRATIDFEIADQEAIDVPNELLFALEAKVLSLTPSK